MRYCPRLISCHDHDLAINQIKGAEILYNGALYLPIYLLYFVTFSSALVMLAEFLGSNLSFKGFRRP